MTPTDVEGRLRAALYELTGTTPLANPEHPRAGATPSGALPEPATAPLRMAGPPVPPSGGRGVGDTPRRPARANAKVLALVACVVVLIAAVVIVGTHHDAPRSLPPAAGSGTTAPATATDVVVPDVVGQLSPSALAVLDTAGLQYHVTPVPSSRPAGTVVSESPAAGTTVGVGSTVTLDVSTRLPGPAPTTTTMGGATVTMPDLVGLSAVQVEQKLKAADLVCDMNVVKDTSVPSPTVLSQSPAAGVGVPTGSAVAVTVAYARSVPVPDVVGDSPTQARQALERAGLQVVIGSETSTTAPDSLVVTAQTPAAGTVVTSGSTVTLDESPPSGSALHG